MKKTILLLILIASAAFAGSYTSNLNMYKPFPKESGWADVVNTNNWDKLDDVITKITNTQANVTRNARYSSEFSSFENALSTIGSTTATLIINSPLSATTSTSTPNTLLVSIQDGGLLTIASGMTVSFAKFKAPLDKVLSCSTTTCVTFGSGSVKEVYPEWWGITGSNDEVAINTAVSSIANNKNASIILTKTYNITNPVNIDSSYITLRGGVLNQAGTGPVLAIGKNAGVIYAKVDTHINLSSDVSSTSRALDVGLMRWSDVKAKVTYNYLAGSPASNNIGLYISTDQVTGTFDNHFDLDISQIGTAIVVNTPDNGSIPFQGNTFKIRTYTCTNGIYLKGASGNLFDINTLELWTTAQKFFELRETASTAVPVTRNVFNINYIETHDTTTAYSNVTLFAADASTKNNLFYVNNNGSGPFYEGMFVPPLGNSVVFSSGYSDLAYQNGDTPSSSNVIQQPHRFATTWIASSLTISTANNVYSPMGGTSFGQSDKLNQTAAGGSVYYPYTPVTLPIDQQWTFSVWLKADQNQYAYINLMAFDAGFVHSYSILKEILVTTNWKRYYVSDMVPHNYSYLYLRAYISPGRNIAGYPLQSVYAWGAQLEHGKLGLFNLSFPSADQGDATISAIPHITPETILFATTITANRVVSLSTEMAHPGDKFKIVRTGLGNYTIDVGGLKTLPVNVASWCTVEFSGVSNAWKLTGYGTL